jgi:hypothetical protein
MPTAAKLAAAIGFLLVGFFTAEVMKPSLPEGTSLGWFSVVCAVLGFLAGWFIMGTSPLANPVKAMGAGLKTAIILLFWGLALFSIYTMLVRAMDRRYRGIMDAVEGTLAIMVDFMRILLDAPLVLGVLVIGGMLAGVFTRWAGVRWP